MLYIKKIFNVYRKISYVCGMIRIGVLISLILIPFFGLIGQDKMRYIETYRDIAIAEMYRTGIPASIKLAQGMLESNCGGSELARRANNHFGIKCGSDWRGKDFHREDDDYIDGKLVKSCFREFRNATESYIAHSDFLTDPKKASRYGCLFELQADDYKAWARGLSKCGYATDPKYADKLIRIIEENELFSYDTGGGRQASRGSRHTKQHAGVRYNNEVRFITARQGDQMASIASTYDVSERQLLLYNDYIIPAAQPIAAGTKVYLQPKRTKYTGKQKHHTLRTGETMASVSQDYGIKLESLLRRNGLAKTDIPATGQKIVLKGKSKSTLRTVDPYQAPPPAPTQVSEPTVNRTQTHARNEVTKPEVQLADTGFLLESMPHEVGKGDTLFSIARQYGISVDDLKKRNNLDADTIFIGQKLVVK